MQSHKVAKLPGKNGNQDMKIQDNTIKKAFYNIELLTVYCLNALAWHLWRKRNFDKVWQKQNYKWIFIMGCNDSGTSLLYNILGEHPQIAKVASESVNLSNIWPSYITNVLPSSLKLGLDRAYSERLDIFHLTEKDTSIDENRLRYDWLNIVKAQKREGRPYLLEKTTENAIRSRWLQKIFPNSYFISIVRNGYATCEGLRRNTNYLIERCAKHWNMTNKIMLEDSKHLKKFKLIKYEDFTEDPKKILSDIADFLEVEKEPFQKLVIKTWQIQNIYGKSMTIRNLNQASIDRLSKEDIDIIAKEAKETLKYFNYSIKSKNSIRTVEDR